MTVCVACGAPRSILAGVPANVAGKPSAVGGGIARVLGWLTIGLTLLAASAVAALLQAIFPAGIAGWVIGGSMALLGLVVGVLLLMGGGKLSRAGAERELEAYRKTLRALVSRGRGGVTAEEVAQALGAPVDRADAMLTMLAKRGEGVELEVDDDGRLLYRVGPRFGVRVDAAPGQRIAAPLDEVSLEEDEAIVPERGAARRHAR